MNYIERKLKEDFVWHTRQLKARNNWLCKGELPKEGKSKKAVQNEDRLLALGIQPDYLTFVNELKAER